MKKILAVLFCLSTFMTHAQQPVYKTIPDPKKGTSNMLVGQLLFENIATDNTCDWFTTNAQAYVPDSNICKSLQKALKGYEIVVFAGTWCGDTQDLLPPFYSTMQAAKYPLNEIQLYGVDRKKQALNVEHLLYRIEKVPTFIIIKNHEEIGRIVETAEGKIEENLLRILLKNTSK
jgi:thiol-disulfide isomerase/thioredoxin